MSRSMRAERAGLWRTRRRWTAEDAREALEAQSRSGLCAARFAKQEGVGAQRLYWWARRLTRVERREEFVEIVPLQTTRPPESARDGQMEVVLRGGLVIRLNRGFDAESLVRLITTLEASSC